MFGLSIAAIVEVFGALETLVSASSMIEWPPL